MFGNNPFDLRGRATQETVLSELTPAQKQMKMKAQGGIRGREGGGAAKDARAMGARVDHQGRGLKKTHKPGDRTTGYSGDYRTAQARKKDAETGTIAKMAYHKDLRKKDPRSFAPDSKLSDLRRKHSAKIGRDMSGNKIKESVYVIPEEIPANERTAFHGAAAAAAKAGKKSFNFGGKTHPVTMKKDTAKQIPTEALDQKDKSTLMKVAKKLKGASAAHAGQSKAIMKDIQDQKDMDPKDHVGKSKKNPGMFCVFDKDGKEVKLFKDKKDAEDYAMKNHDKLMEGYMKDLATNKTEPKPRSDAKVAADFKKRRKMAGKDKAEGGGKEGDVQMNPKMETQKEELQSYRIGHRSIGGNVHAKSEKDGIAQLRKKGIKGKITLTHRGPAPKPPKGMGESSKIRESLLSVLEKKHDDHYKSATEPEMMKDKLKGKGAQDMAAGAEKEISKGPDAHLDEPDMLKKDRAKMTSNVKKSPMRKTDNPKGDTTVVPGGTPMKDPAAMKSESYDKMSGLYAAYASMYKTEEVTDEIQESMLGHSDADKLGKSRDDKFKSAASHIDYHHRQSGGHNKSGGDQDRHRYQVAKKLGYSV
jgi:hypothetical protein